MPIQHVASLLWGLVGLSWSLLDLLWVRRPWCHEHGRQHSRESAFQLPNNL